MASKEELEKEYVDFAVKMNDRHSLKSNSDILEWLNVEISTVSDGAFFNRQFACKVHNFGFMVLKLFEV